MALTTKVGFGHKVYAVDSGTGEVKPIGVLTAVLDAEPAGKPGVRHRIGYAVTAVEVTHVLGRGATALEINGTAFRALHKNDSLDAYPELK